MPNNLNLLDDVIHPKPKQKQLLTAMFEKEYVLYGGAAGPGKSYILRWGAVWFLWRCFKDLGLKNVMVGLFCETYRDLYDRQISKIKSEFPAWLGVFNDARKEFKLAAPFGGGIIAFRNLDEAEKYKSVEFAALFVDELTMNDRQTFDDLRSRKRWPGLNHNPFVAASNPNGPGHDWVKKLFVDRNFSGEPTDEEEIPAPGGGTMRIRPMDPDQFLFIRALPQDNDSLPPSYYRTLASLPENMRKALLMGDWDIYTGQMFTQFREVKVIERPATGEDVLKQHVGLDLSVSPAVVREYRYHHVIPPVDIPKHWDRYEGHDWGYQDAAYTCWAAVDPKGGVIVYKEHQARRLTGEELARSIMATRGSDRVLATYAGADLWYENRAHLSERQLQMLQDTGEAQFTKAEQYEAAGFYTLVRASTRNREARVLKVAQYLGERPDGVPWLRITNNCPILINCLKYIQVDEDNPNDVITEYPPDAKLRDDPYDALGHLLVMLPSGPYVHDDLPARGREAAAVW